MSVGSGVGNGTGSGEGGNLFNYPDNSDQVL